jgi:ABC-type glycerol-3-phosphate transport system permease component
LACTCGKTWATTCSLSGGAECSATRAAGLARVDGANAWQRFFAITSRYLMPTLLFTIIIAFINSFKIFRETYLLAATTPMKTLHAAALHEQYVPFA